MSDTTYDDEPVASSSNPFAMQVAPAQPTGALATTDMQKGIAEVQARLIVARANPRNPVKAMQDILDACARPTLANAAVYSYPRGHETVSGPSIRLAECMAQAWGNIDFGIREIDQVQGMSVVQAFAWDVQTNVRREVTFQVPHVRDLKSGSKKVSGSRDIYEIVANMGSRRLRACILAVIPGDVAEAAVAECDKTMQTTVDMSPEGMAKMVKAFSKFNVTVEHIEKRTQRKLGALQPAQVVQLTKIYHSLRDGVAGPGDFFDIGEPSGETTSVADIKAKAAVAEQAKKDAAQKSDELPIGGKVDQVTGEITGERADFDLVVKAIREAKTKKTADGHMAQARDMGFSAEDLADLELEHKKRVESFERG